MREMRVRDCDLFDISPEIVRSMFGKALSHILVKLDFTRHDLSQLVIRFENMRPLAVDLLNQEVRRISVASDANTLVSIFSGFDSRRLA